VKTSGYAIFVHALVEGWTPLVRDGANRPVIFASELEAQREIADGLITKLQEFLAGERDFEDATTVDEHVVKVSLRSDSSVEDEHGTRFS